MAEALLREFRYSLRALRKSRGFAAVAVLTLGLGIGASTAIFSIVDAVLLRPLPYPKAGQIVRLWELSAKGHRMNLANGNFEDFQREGNTFSSLAEYVSIPTAVSGIGEPAQVDIAEVTAGFFESLGVAPERGRMFTPAEMSSEGAETALVSYRYWRRNLGGAADLGQVRLKFEGGVFAVAGVMPESFDYPPGTAIWIPRKIPLDTSRTGHNWRGIGRIRDGVTLAQARANLSAIARRIRQQYGGKVHLVDAAVVPLAESMVGDVRTALLTLLGAVGLLLLVACANVAGLLIARTAARRRELAVRAALGVGRGRLIQQFLAESFWLAAGGGLLGIALAAWAVGTLPGILPLDLPRREGIALNGQVLLFALSAVAAVAIALGLFAAWRAARGDLQEALASGSRGTGGASGSQRFRGFVVAGEIAATLVILVAAGLLGRSFLQLLSIEPGFNPRNLATIEFPLPDHQWHGPTADPAAGLQRIRFVDNLLARLHSIPGAGSVGLAGAMPVAAGDDLPEGDFLILRGGKAPANFQEFGRIAQIPSQTGHALYCVAGADYFRTMGIPLIRGRIFDSRDDGSAPHVAVISAALARSRWPNQDPIGEVIEFGNMDGNLKPMTIIGIAGDVRARGLDAPAGEVIYVDYHQRGLNANASPTILIRSAAPLGEIAAAARAVFHEVAPDLPVKFSTYDAEMGGWLAGRRFLLLLVGAFAAAALALAAVGIYGIVSFSVTRRTQEIGIRMALGAQRGDVLRLVVGEGAKLALLGVAAGALLSVAATRLMTTLLFGISATDPATFAVVAALLTGVALLASYLPARRALRLDPNLALRHE